MIPVSASAVLAASMSNAGHLVPLTLVLLLGGIGAILYFRRGGRGGGHH